MAQTAQGAAIDSYIRARIEQELTARLRDQSSLVREIGDEAEDVVWARLKRYTWAAVAIGAVLGLWGIKSIDDAGNRIVEGARQRVEPVIRSTETRAKTAQEQIEKTAQQVVVIQKSVDNLATLMETQRKRVVEQGGEVEQKLKELDSAFTGVNRLSSSFQLKVRELESSVDNLRRGFDIKLAQVSKAVDRQSVSAAYPNIDQEPFVTITGGGRLDKAQKKSGERWVNIQITQNAIERRMLPGDRFENLLGEIRNAGFVALPGLIFVRGRVSGVVERMGPRRDDKLGVFYFDNSFRQGAERIASIASKYLNIELSAVLVDQAALKTSPFIDQRTRVAVDQSGIDCQLFISATPQ